MAEFPTSPGVWPYLHRRLELREKRRLYALENPRRRPLGWPDARGWIGLGVFGIAIMLLWMLRDKSMREDEFFQTIATVIISNGLMAVVAWAYAATKGGGELAERNAAIAERASAPGGRERNQP